MSGFLALNIAAITAREQPEASDDGKSFWCEAPPGWKKRVTYRSTPVVNNKCKADVYFYAPSDSIQTTRFRSEKKLREYLLKNTGLIPDLPSPEAFDWSYPGGTREGKCKSGPPLSFKAAPDTPRHAPVKTTGKRDPRKRPRDSPKGGQPGSGEQPLMPEAGLANGDSERAIESSDAQPLEEKFEGQEAKPGEKETEESSGDRSRSEAGPVAKKRKGKVSAGTKLAEGRDVESGQSTPADQSTSGSVGTKGESEVGAHAEVKDKVEASAEKLSGPGDKEIGLPSVPAKRKGRPPRVKKEGSGVEKVGSMVGEKSEDLRGEENGAQLPSEGLVNGNKPAVGAAAMNLADGTTVRTGAAPDGVADSDQARLGANEGAELRHSDQQKAGGLPEGASQGQVPGFGAGVGRGRGKKIGDVAAMKKSISGVTRGDPRGQSEGSRKVVPGRELPEGNLEDQENQWECRKRALVDTSKVESSPPLSEVEERQSNQSVKADAKGAAMCKVRDPSLKEQALDRIDIKVENEEVGGCSRGSVLENTEVKIESGCVDRQALEPADGTATPLSILDAERNGAMNGGPDTGTNPTPTEERSPARKEDGEEAVKAPAAESPELQCSESVPSPEQGASEDPVDTAPSVSQPELEPSVTKAMKKKARLAKVLGPHEVLERPRRERAPSGPPAMSAPRGIADAVKLRTAGMQAEKKSSRQQVGERFYTNRMPPGLSVSAVIAAAAAAPPSPVPRIRGRPPKQKNGVGTSRLGGGKQSGEDAEEKRAQEHKEEHEAAVRIFQEEEAERERVLKERGKFHPPDDTLADRPKLTPVKGKRRTKSAIVAEHWERLAQAKLELGEDEWLLPEDEDENGMGEQQFDGGAPGTELNGQRMEVRVWMKSGRSAGDDLNRGNELDASGEIDTWNEKNHVRKKRKGGWTAVRTQKRTALANRGGEAGPSRRRPSQHPRAHCPYMPSDPEPDPTYDSDANSSELKMGQKLDEHGFFERDEFEVASQEPCGRKPPRERLPLEAPPQRRRSFGHRKGPSGVQVREGVRKPSSVEGRADMAADVAADVAALVGSGIEQGANELKPAIEASEDKHGGGDASVGGVEAKCEVREEPEKEMERFRWEGAWGAAAAAGPLLDNGMHVSVGRRSAEPLTLREHFAAAPTLTSV